MRIYNAMIDVDLSELLGAVTCPVLVVRTQDSGLSNPVSARQFAARLPNATLGFTPGTPGEGASEDMVRLIGEFLGEEWTDLEVHVPAQREPLPQLGGLRTLLFTDLEGHSAMMSRLGDEKGRDVLREHDRLTRDALALHGGAEVKTLGDGFMASFGSAQRALECAIELQREVTRSPVLGPIDLRVRIGLNAGEPIAEDDDLFGTSVIAAARIAARAAGGEVLVANVVRELVAGKGFLFNDRGPLALKGLDEPVRVWSLKWD
jgi:class 3 adenylate cyclase